METGSIHVKRTFTLEYWIDDSWYVGRLREVPGVFGQGATLEELEANIQDAYAMVAAEQDDYRPPMEVQTKELSVRT